MYYHNYLIKLCNNTKICIAKVFVPCIAVTNSLSKQSVCANIALCSASSTVHYSELHLYTRCREQSWYCL